MGTLEDLGYSVNRDLQQEFGLGDMDGGCGNFCPEATRRRLGSPINSLSSEGHRRVRETAKEHFAEGAGYDHRNVVSVAYEEDGQIFSRIVRREDLA